MTSASYRTRATVLHMDTDLPDLCRYTETWHRGAPEQRNYRRTSRTHDTHTERFESGRTLTACHRCGALAGDY